jgi:hypothetical protein
MTELTGHTTPETGYLVADYPYGFRLRTEIRYWIETKHGHGQRTMSQTRNPKRAGNPWNKPKGSIYSPIRALYLDETTGHVEHAALSPYANEAEIMAFAERFPQTCADVRNARVIEFRIAAARANARVEWKVVGAGEATQTVEEQAEIMRKLRAIELAKMRAEGGQ